MLPKTPTEIRKKQLRNFTAAEGDHFSYDSLSSSCDVRDHETLHTTPVRHQPGFDYRSEETSTASNGGTQLTGPLHSARICLFRDESSCAVQSDEIKCDKLSSAEW